MKVVLTQQELAERWGVTVKTIAEYRNDGIITPIKGIPAIRFSIKYVEELEGVKLEKFSPLEKARMEKELKELESLRFENKKLKTILSNVLSETSKVIGL
ncbi:MAG: helix-turn-helix domain-containing protein [Clostridium sp.]|uniref:helix-turn-helix domain-containing protein n=1 Tax=Clostridium sp. TaxID=1506 RepID=UPI003F3BEB2A